jgi:hypothetical protein
MLQKSLAGRLTVTFLVTTLLAGGIAAVFGSLVPTLFAETQPSMAEGTKHQQWCIETAIYLQDYMDNSFSHHIGTAGVMEGVQNIDVQNWNGEFQKKLTDAKTACMGDQPDPNQAMHRLFLGLEEEHKAYVFWATSTRMLRHNFVRDSQIALSETTLP